MRPWLLPALLACLLIPVPSFRAQDVAPDAPASGWSFQADYLLWWLRRGSAPPVLTTSSPASQGLLGQPDTRVVYGGDRLETRHHDEFVGGRFAANWMAADDTIGFEGRGFVLERDSTYFTLKQRSDQVLALSYVDANTGRQASEIIAGPDPKRGLLWGGFVGYSRIELFGEEADAVIPLLVEGNTYRLDALAGARFLQMRDRYHDTATSYVLPAKAVIYGVDDNIRVHNAFYGGQIGVRGEARYGRFTVQVRKTIAIGADDQEVKTFGDRVYATPQKRVQTPGGLYIQPSNSGHFTNCNFDTVGELGVNLGYDVTEWMRATIGYTLIYWADPIRAAGQLDRVVNTAQPAGPASPRIPFEGDAFWAQGLTAGLRFSW